MAKRRSRKGQGTVAAGGSTSTGKGTSAPCTPPRKKARSESMCSILSHITAEPSPKSRKILLDITPRQPTTAPSSRINVSDKPEGPSTELDLSRHSPAAPTFRGGDDIVSLPSPARPTSSSPGASSPSVASTYKDDLQDAGQRNGDDEISLDNDQALGHDEYLSAAEYSSPPNHGCDWLDIPPSEAYSDLSASPRAEYPFEPVKYRSPSPPGSEISWPDTVQDEQPYEPMLGMAEDMVLDAVDDRSVTRPTNVKVVEKGVGDLEDVARRLVLRASENLVSAVMRRQGGSMAVEDLVASMMRLSTARKHDTGDSSLVLPRPSERLKQTTLFGNISNGLANRGRGSNAVAGPSRLNT